jgi:hypothetical protein
MRPEEQRERRLEVGRWQVRLVSYRLGGEYVCTADNVDPGANVARARAQTRFEAESRALAQARERLARTRERHVP